VFRLLLGFADVDVQSNLSFKCIKALSTTKPSLDLATGASGEVDMRGCLCAYCARSDGWWWSQQCGHDSRELWIAVVMVR
jgi:hypothetical protein